MTNRTGPGGASQPPDDIAQRLLARAPELDGRLTGASIPQFIFTLSR